MMELISNQFLIYLVTGFNYCVIFYFSFANSVYLLLLGISTFVSTSQWRRSQYAGYQEMVSSPLIPPVSILVPARNESLTISDSVCSLLTLEYPMYEVIVINDGSTDSTLEELIRKFHLRKMDIIYRPIIPTGPVRAFYVTSEHPNLMVIDKPRSGKPDSLNVGINACRSPYFCSVDADTVLEKDALLKIMKPVLEEPELVVASGGIVRVLDGCVVEEGQVKKIDLPKNRIQMFQVVEYLRSFLFGRTGWSALNCLLVLSGAFSVFKKVAVQEIKGYSTRTETEDMDIIVRLHRYMKEKKEKYKVLFVPEPVSWTQVPDQYRSLALQRRRWQRGLAVVLLSNLRMFFNPRYGGIGFVAVPYNFFVEFLGPVIELLGYFSIALSFYFGIINYKTFWLFVLLAFVYSMLLSTGAIFIEENTFRRYPKLRSLVRLLLFGVMEHLGYRQLNAWWRFWAMFQLAWQRGKAWERTARRNSSSLATPNAASNTRRVSILSWS